MDKLKHCPFCGSKTPIIDTDESWHRVLCPTCGSSSMWVSSKSLAAILWNARECDREGLLALADQYEKNANRAADEAAKWPPHYRIGMSAAYELVYIDAASSIRELCRVIGDE